MSTSSQQNITPEQALAWLTTGEAILIDVREADEFKTEHIAYATSLPLAQVSGLFKQIRLAPERKVIFQCLSGRRGEQACSVISQHETGCAVYNIQGGITGWKNAGLPVVSSGGAKISIFRQVQIIVGSLVLLFTLLGASGQTWGFAVAGLLGAALAFAGITGWCGLALLLSKAPWN